jgi:hypothetical protein
MNGEDEEESGCSQFEGNIPAFTQIDCKYGTYLVIPFI